MKRTQAKYNICFMKNSVRFGKKKVKKKKKLIKIEKIKRKHESEGKKLEWRKNSHKYWKHIRLSANENKFDLLYFGDNMLLLHDLHTNTRIIWNTSKASWIRWMRTDSRAVVAWKSEEANGQSVFVMKPKWMPFAKCLECYSWSKITSIYWRRMEKDMSIDMRWKCFEAKFKIKNSNTFVSPFRMKIQCGGRTKSKKQ